MIAVLDSQAVRSRISFLTGLFFFVVTVTGILLLFHLRVPGVKPLHELGAIAFTLAGALHCTVHWKAFVSHCRTRFALWASLAIVLLAAALVAAESLHPEEARTRPSRIETHPELTR